MTIKQQFYCASDFAKLIGVSRQAIYQRISKGTIPTVRFGGVRLIPSEIVDIEVGKAISKWEKINKERDEKKP